MAGLRALIFDVDGTLADSERDGHRVAFNRAFAEAGLDWRWSVRLYGELLAVAGGTERIRHYVSRYRPDFDPPAGLNTFIARLHAAKTRHYQKLLAEEGIPLRPGVRRLLEEARAEGVRLAIATTTMPENATALLVRTLGPDGPAWFDAIAAGDSVAAKKPAPDVYQHVLERLGLDARECLAFEDSENGLRAARGAGVRTVVTVNAYTRDQDFAGAALVLDHLGEPDLPFTVLAGDPPGVTYMDLALARRLHAG